ncbi:MAG: alpha-L-fucosidase [Planctomycetales bacterium]|nr:alpha-L-fucosidase [Planctomycetales bacterium]
MSSLLLRAIGSKLLLTMAFAILPWALACAEEGPFTPDWESLRQRPAAPDWFRDAKFGVYFHWGVYSVPAYDSEWYPRNMHDKGKDGRGRVYQHHLTTYGDPAEFGYDRFVDDFTAEHFDADEWCELFLKSGARYVGPVAEHHDGFAMWHSEATPWNCVDRGPKRDILGELAAAARKRDLKVVATFHHARNNLWEKPNSDGTTQWTGHYSLAKENFPQVLDKPERAFLYGYMPRQQFLDMWLAKLEEVIDGYDPDLIWFDSWLDEIPDEYKTQFLAYYFNHARSTGQQVVVTYKQRDLPQDVGVLDLEKGSLEDLADFAWLADDTISLGSWCYTQDLKIKPTHVVVHSLIDIVSKNGQLLLNISPTSDGRIPDEQRQVLLGIGEWLAVNGEAIYDTRPFDVYGHGSTSTKKGHFGGIATDQGYTASDIRYTRKGPVVYALQLGWPGGGETTLLQGFSERDGRTPPKVAQVSMLGSDAVIAWKQTPEGVAVTSPEQPPNPMAVVYRILCE